MDIAELKKMLKESLSVGVIYTLAELVTGAFLIGLEKELLVLPGLAIILPGIMDMRGSISSTLAARLGTALHLGWAKPELAIKGEIGENIIATLVLTVIMNMAVVILAFFIASFLGMQIPFWKLLLICLVAGTLAGLIITGFALVITVESFRIGWDPNNITSPAVATLGDMITLLSLLITVKAFVWVGLI